MTSTNPSLTLTSSQAICMGDLIARYGDDMLMGDKVTLTPAGGGAVTVAMVQATFVVGPLGMHTRTVYGDEICEWCDNAIATHRLTEPTDASGPVDQLVCAQCAASSSAGFARVSA